MATSRSPKALAAFPPALALALALTLAAAPAPVSASAPSPAPETVPADAPERIPSADRPPDRSVVPEARRDTPSTPVHAKSRAGRTDVPAEGEAPLDTGLPSETDPPPAVPILRILHDFRSGAAVGAAYGAEGGVVVTEAEIWRIIQATEHTYIIVLGAADPAGDRNGARTDELRCRIETPDGLPETAEALRGYRTGDRRLFTGMYLDTRPEGPVFSCFDTLAMDAAAERIRSSR